jgi:hypothetical protein
MLPFEAKMEIIRIKNLLKESDTSVIYGLEEMFLLLIRTKIIQWNDVNQHLLKKITTRMDLRKRLTELNTIANNTEAK